MEKNSIIIVETSDKKQLKLDERIIEWSPVLKNACSTETIRLEMIDSKTLDFIYKFYEGLNFNIPTVTKEVKSNDLSIVLKPEFYNPLKTFIKSDGQIDIDKIKPIIDGCYFYDFKELKDILLMAIGSAFYFKIDSLNEFKDRWKMDKTQENLTTHERLNLITQYEDVFKYLIENILKDINK